MVALYIVAGLAVSLCLHLFSESHNKSISELNIAEIGFAIVLTSLTWPIVAVMLVFESAPVTLSNKRKVKRTDLVLPLNINNVEERTLIQQSSLESPKLSFGSNYKKWQALKHKKTAKDSIWSFRTHAKYDGDRVLEGYALVDEDRNIIDYLIVKKQSEKFSQSAIHH